MGEGRGGGGGSRNGRPPTPPPPQDYLREEVEGPILIPLTSALLSARPVGADVGSFSAMWLAGEFLKVANGRGTAVPRPRSQQEITGTERGSHDAEAGVALPAIKGAKA